MKNHKLTLFSWANLYQTTRISAKVRYTQVSSFAHIHHVIPVKITFCTLFSLLQVLKRFTATYSEKPQTNAIFMGNLYQITRISAKVRYKQVSSMKLSYFLEIFLQQSYMQVSYLQWAYVA